MALRYMGAALDSILERPADTATALKAMESAFHDLGYSVKRTYNAESHLVKIDKPGDDKVSRSYMFLVRGSSQRDIWVSTKSFYVKDDGRLEVFSDDNVHMIDTHFDLEKHDSTGRQELTRLVETISVKLGFTRMKLVDYHSKPEKRSAYVLT